jgi:hypothetical protein
MKRYTPEMWAEYQKRQAKKKAFLQKQKALGDQQRETAALGKAAKNTRPVWSDIVKPIDPKLIDKPFTK